MRNVVLALDPCLTRQTASLRRDLLRLLGVGEFSAAAIFTPPHMASEHMNTEKASSLDILPHSDKLYSLLVYLADVACPVCNTTRDLDVCRDTNLVWITTTTANNEYYGYGDGDNSDEGESESSASPGHWAWSCPQCQVVYPRAGLEVALLSQLEQMALQFILQDLQCTKCTIGGGIQAAVLANGAASGRCADCASPLSLTISAMGGTFRRRLDVYRAIGKAFGFHLLHDMAYWMLRKQNTI
ncbi:unnamed protein product [Protopolystoma xenopodis]|uniref:DNA polymerase epsilon catalytic subunit n=1 Tax=Protopolystoma xenopodis TaxID=117903 RepID=A0A448XKI8_9PLAT|nr:unnamed protein product [Protopolystoma xenopodis]